MLKAFWVGEWEPQTWKEEKVMARLVSELTDSRLDREKGTLGAMGKGRNSNTDCSSLDEDYRARLIFLHNQETMHSPVQCYLREQQSSTQGL